MTTSDESPKSRRLDAALLRDPVHLLALGFGTGLSPVAPGTFGSLVGLVFALLLQPFGAAIMVGATVLAIVIGIPICGTSARKLGVHDHSGIVWDEIAGMMVAMLAAPPTLRGALAAFALFRLFDIWKPWPIREIDHGMHGGLGIILDDILAGLLAALGLLLVRNYV